ncbi:uncharacterized protein ARMOST_02323 [Armillaria ostoyae]|uniref:Uncharacterized protein n=1 Tax=Armillaria ostoyae TaxID=47428 RepID=A0A284QRC8_ARMOS|nr:uncharacterized protein ARMOST_02323 [Armillaria ostoyae]
MPVHPFLLYAFETLLMLRKKENHSSEIGPRSKWSIGASGKSTLRERWTLEDTGDLLGAVPLAFPLGSCARSCKGVAADYTPRCKDSPVAYPLTTTPLTLQLQLLDTDMRLKLTIHYTVQTFNCPISRSSFTPNQSQFLCEECSGHRVRIKAWRCHDAQFAVSVVVHTDDAKDDCPLDRMNDRMYTPDVFETRISFTPCCAQRKRWTAYTSIRFQREWPKKVSELDNVCCSIMIILLRAGHLVLSLGKEREVLDSALLDSLTKEHIAKMTRTNRPHMYRARVGIEPRS